MIYISYCLGHTKLSYHVGCLPKPLISNAPNFSTCDIPYLFVHVKYAEDAPVSEF